MSFGAYPFPGTTAYVFSRRRAGERDEHAEFVSSPLGPFTRALCAQPGKHIWLVGGGELTREFLNEDLIDDAIVSIHPVVLGAGRPLSPAPIRETRLQHVETLSFPSGLVQLHYQGLRS